MKAEYDLSKMNARKNPYATKLKKPVTMRLSEEVVLYFKDMAIEAGVPYQSLINLYLRDCVAQHRKVKIAWPGKPYPSAQFGPSRRRPGPSPWFYNPFVSANRFGRGWAG